MAETMGISREVASGVLSRAMAVRNSALSALSEERSPFRRLGRTFGVGAGVSTFAYINGRYSNPKVAGAVGYDLVASLLIHGGSMLAGGFMSRRAASQGRAIGSTTRLVLDSGHAFADGALASYLAKMFAGLGVDARAKASAGEKAAYAGAYGHMSGTSNVGALSANEAAIYAE